MGKTHSFFGAVRQLRHDRSRAGPCLLGWVGPTGMRPLVGSEGSYIQGPQLDSRGQ